jgi:soluble lytic murein transglycosylase
MQSIPRDYVQLLEHQRKHKDAWKIFYPEAYEKIISPISKGIKISPYLVLAIMRAESFYNKDANSPVGAYGLMQLMPYTALKIANLLHDEEFDMLELGRPEVNISYGAYYLDRLIRYYSGNPYVAVAAYNAGPKAVSQWVTSCAQCEPDEFIESIPFRETRRYVREVMRNFVQYNRIYLERPEPLPLPPMPSRLPEEEIF